MLKPVFFADSDELVYKPLRSLDLLIKTGNFHADDDDDRHTNGSLHPLHMRAGYIVATSTLWSRSSDQTNMDSSDQNIVLVKVHML